MKITIEKLSSAYRVKIDLQGFTVGNSKIDKGVLLSGSFNNWIIKKNDQYRFVQHPHGGNNSFLPLTIDLPLSPTQHEFKLYDLANTGDPAKGWYEPRQSSSDPYFGDDVVFVKNSFGRLNCFLDLERITQTGEPE